MKVYYKKMHSNATEPNYATEGDAGMDLTAVQIISNDDQMTVYDTGIAVEIPEGYVGLVFPRSSVRKLDLIMANSVGVIDSGYRGSIQVSFKRTKGMISKIYQVGERICQLMIVPYPYIKMIETEELSSSSRGEGGHGSTGK